MATNIKKGVSTVALIAFVMSAGACTAVIETPVEDAPQSVVPYGKVPDVEGELPRAEAPQSDSPRVSKEETIKENTVIVPKAPSVSSGGSVTIVPVNPSAPSGKVPQSAPAPHVNASPSVHVVPSRPHVPSVPPVPVPPTSSGNVVVPSVPTPPSNSNPGSHVTPTPPPAPTPEPAPDVKETEKERKVRELKETLEKAKVSLTQANVNLKVLQDEKVRLEGVISQKATEKDTLSSRKDEKSAVRAQHVQRAGVLQDALIEKTPALNDARERLESVVASLTEAEQNVKAVQDVYDAVVRDVERSRDWSFIDWQNVDSATRDKVVAYLVNEKLNAIRIAHNLPVLPVHRDTNFESSNDLNDVLNNVNIGKLKEGFIGPDGVLTVKYRTYTGVHAVSDTVNPVVIAREIFEQMKDDVASTVKAGDVNVMGSAVKVVDGRVAVVFRTAYAKDATATVAENVYHQENTSRMALTNNLEDVNIDNPETIESTVEQVVTDGSTTVPFDVESMPTVDGQSFPRYGVDDVDEARQNLETTIQESNVEGLRNMKNVMRENFDKVNGEVEKIDAELSRESDAVRGLNEEIQEIDSKVEVLSGEVESLTSNVADTVSEISSAEKAVEDAQKNVDAISAEIAELEAQTDS